MSSLPKRRAIPRGSIRFSARQLTAVLRGLVSTEPGERCAIEALEGAFAAWLGARHAVATASGKSALIAILRALGARPGDGVVLACFNVPEVVSVLAGLGLVPELADIDGRSYGLSPDAASEAVTGRTRFVLATHLYGSPADLDALSDLCRRRGLVLLEDCAQALGARWRARPVGTLGRAGLFSFGLMKNLNALRGGMVVTDDDELAAAVRAHVATMPAGSRLAVLRDLLAAVALSLGTNRSLFALAGLPFVRVLERTSPALLHDLVKLRPGELESGRVEPGAVSRRLTAAQALCGTAALAGVDAGRARRARNAARLLSELRGVEGVRCPVELDGAESAWTQFVVRVADRASVRRHLLRRGIDTTTGYLMACHRLPGQRGERRYPQSTALEEEGLYLPIGEELDADDMAWIAHGLREAVGSARRPG